MKKIGDKWKTNSNNLRIRKYNSYEDYVIHQADKLKRVKILLDNYDIQYREILRKRLSEKAYSFKGKNALFGCQNWNRSKIFLRFRCFCSWNRH